MGFPWFMLTALSLHSTYPPKGEWREGGRQGRGREAGEREGGREGGREEGGREGGIGGEKWELARGHMREILFVYQAERAGVISRYQLALADRLGDNQLASRCKLYAAYSLLQRNKLCQAARMVR
jgi:hypothetical protein